MSLILESSISHALSLDPKLHGLCGTSCESGDPVPDQDAFNGLSRAYGLALSPMNLTPANTIGINAVEMDFGFTFNSLSESATPWVSAING
jgi:hypothetical protein